MTGTDCFDSTVNVFQEDDDPDNDLEELSVLSVCLI